MKIKYKACLGKTKDKKILPIRILKVHIEVSGRSDHVPSLDSLINTLLSQVCRLETDSYYGNDGQNIRSKVRGEGEDPLIAQVWLQGQMAVIYSHDCLQ